MQNKNFPLFFLQKRAVSSMSCANDPNIIFSKYNDVKNWWGCFLFFNFYEAHHDVIETITDRYILSGNFWMIFVILPFESKLKIGPQGYQVQTLRKICKHQTTCRHQDCRGKFCCKYKTLPKINRYLRYTYPVSTFHTLW